MGTNQSLIGDQKHEFAREYLPAPNPAFMSRQPICALNKSVDTGGEHLDRKLRKPKESDSGLTAQEE